MYTQAVWHYCTPSTGLTGRKEMFYLTTHSTHFIYGYMASDIWLRTTQIVTEETRCRYIGYSFRLAARVLLYAPSQRQDSTYHSLCYTSRGALAGMRNSSMGPPHEGLIWQPIAHWTDRKSVRFLSTFTNAGTAGYVKGDNSHTIPNIIILEGRKEMFYDWFTQHILFTVIWRQTYGKGPFWYWERKPTTTTWANLSD